MNPGKGGSPASEAQAKVGLLASAAESSLPVHPTQIYESAACFAIAAYLILRLHGNKRYDGQVFLSFVALYAGVRFVIEFLRNDDRGGLFGLSTSQLIGLALLFAAYRLHQVLLRRSAAALTPPPEPPAPTPGPASESAA